MGQITTGVRSVLDNPVVYILSQNLFGRDRLTRVFVKEFVRPQRGAKVLDIGCGPAMLLEYLPDVEYWGFDIHPAYIQQAKKRYGAAGNFFCKELEPEDFGFLPSFDIVVLLGVLHHLDDITASRLLEIAHRALKPGGRLVTIDPCFETGQHPIARYFISWDRGQNVRTREGYSALIAKTFPKYCTEVLHQLWLPYTRCAAECTRT